MSFPIEIKSPDAPTAAAITDALLRILIGLDTNDRKLYEAGWSSSADPDTVFEMNGKATNINTMFDFIGPLDTQHLVSNVRINAGDDDSMVSLTAYAWAQHHRPGEGVQPGTQHLTSGSQYFLDVEKDEKDSLWKVTKWTMKVTWLDGDASIVGQ